MDSFGEEVMNNVANLKSGVLQSSVSMIPLCFENLSILKVLDLSCTNIQSLPPSISMLSLLANLTLQDCSMLMVIPPEIGILKNLSTFDLEGTEIMYLPIEMGKLENLQCLRVSFCAYADEYKDRNGIENIIPRTILPKLSKLEELSICVNPDAKWWEVEVIEAILEKLHFLTCLQTLKLHLPTAKELQYFLRLENCNVPIYSTLRDFRLKVGHCEQLPSYLQTNLVDGFEKLEKCLKYENSEGSIDDVKELIRHARALFICRHMTIESLSIFDTSSLKYCLLAECNNMRNVVDADDFYGDNNILHDNAFEFLEYLAIHSMKNLQSIWKGPIARSSFSCLQVLALHTCPELITVFTESMLDNLQNLTVVIVEDCPKVNSLIGWRSSSAVLPKLKKILLLDLPELVSLSNGGNIAPRLDTLLVFNCLKLDYLSPNELSRDVKEIKGETEWWDALKNNYEYLRAFVPLKRDGCLMNKLAEVTYSLKELCKLPSHGGPSKMSDSTSVPPDLLQLPGHFNLNATKQHTDWGMFLQFLKYQNPPVHLNQCHSGHVMEFFNYLNKFGDIKVHVQSCVLFGHPNPAATCFCPLREAWGTLEEIFTRLNVAYVEYASDINSLGILHYSRNPFVSRDVHSDLNNIMKSQEIASGVISKMHDFPVQMAKEESDFDWLYSPMKEIPTFPSVNKNGPGSKSRIGRSTKLYDYIQNVHLHSSKISLLKDKFHTILHTEFRSRKDSLSLDPGAVTFPSSSSVDEVEQDDFVISNPMSLKVLFELRNIALKTYYEGYVQPLVEIYIAGRKTMMQRRFIQFNNAKWSTIEWGVLESLIEVWIKSVKIPFNYLYTIEKHMCERIFRGLGTNIEYICFEVIFQDYQIHVFNIIYTLSCINPPPDKLFLILDLYQTLVHFLNETRSFAKTSDPFRGTAHAQLFSVLADKIISSLSMFETVLLYHESSVIFVGPVDPLPMYVMSYLCQLCDHKHTLRKLSLPKLPSIDDDDDLILHSEELKGQSELSRHVIWIIMMIMSNIEGNAKLCEDGCAGHFYAMKNISYIVRKIEGYQELKEVIGYDYYGKLIQKLDQAKVNYLRLELEKIIQMRDCGVE